MRAILLFFILTIFTSGLFLGTAFVATTNSLSVVHAQVDTTDADSGGTVDVDTGGGNTTVGNSGTDAGNSGSDQGNPGPPNVLVNPLKVNSVEAFLLAIIDILLIFAVPVIVFFIIYAGFLFVTAAGNPEKIKTARSALTWAVVGGVILLGANVIMTVVRNTVTAIQP